MSKMSSVEWWALEKSLQSSNFTLKLSESLKRNMRREEDKRRLRDMKKKDIQSLNY